MSLLFLSGGTGTPKLLLGFRKIVEDNEITVITNPGDDWFWHGLLICPDFDTVLYLFTDKLDLKKFWGIKNDTFNALETISSLSGLSWFNVGDKDLGLHVWRTDKFNKGSTLTDIALELTKKWGVKAKILPPTNGFVQTKIKTVKGILDFQEFWVKYHGEIEITDVFFDKKAAEITDLVNLELERANTIIIGPSNPVSSISPILSVNGFSEKIKDNKEKVIAVSPFIGKNVFSGPAAKMMKAKGYEPSSFGMAQMLGDYIGTLIIHENDKQLISDIEKYVPRVLAADTYLDTAEKQVTLAKTILSLVKN